MPDTLKQERFSSGLPPHGRHFDLIAAREEVAGDAAVAGGHVGGRARRHHLAAPLAGAGAEVDHPVGRADRVFVVLDHDHRVALVAEGLERAQELDVVSRMQADRRLVEHVEHPRQTGADLRRQPDPLALAAGEGGRLAVEREIAEAHLIEERKPGADLFHQFDRDQRLRVVEHEIGEKRPRFGDRQRTEPVEGEFGPRDGCLALAERHGCRAPLRPGVPGLPPGAFCGLARGPEGRVSVSERRPAKRSEAGCRGIA